jgi:hypothetical protein
MLVYSAYFLYELLNDPKSLFINEDYRFWIVLAIMIYLSGSFFIYLLANDIPNRELGQYWMYTDIFYTLKNFFFIVSIIVLIKNRPKKKHQEISSIKHFSRTN